MSFDPRNLLPPQMRATGFLVKWGLIIVAALVALFAVWWFLTEPGRANERAAEARAGQTIATGETKITTDSAKAASILAERQRERDKKLEADNADVLSQPGAKLPVDTGVDLAVLRAQCVRHEYQRDRACLRLRQQDSAEHSR